MCKVGLGRGNAGLSFYKSFLPNQYIDLGLNEQHEISVNIVSSGAMYSGAIFASTYCEEYTNACMTGICRNKYCSPFTGAVGPHTRAEFTFNPSGIDFYDVSLMHGVNIPISMKAVGGSVDASNPYSCGTAGSVEPTPFLPGCSYKYNTVVNGQDHTTDLLFVAPPDLLNVRSWRQRCHGFHSSRTFAQLLIRMPTMT